MNFELHYGKIGRTPALEYQIKDMLEKLSEKMKSQSPHCEVWLKSENSIQSAGVPEFQLSVKLKARGKEYFICKNGVDFEKLLNRVRHALEKKLRRNKSEVNHEKLRALSYKKMDLSNQWL